MAYLRAQGWFEQVLRRIEWPEKVQLRLLDAALAAYPAGVALDGVVSSRWPGRVARGVGVLVRNGWLVPIHTSGRPVYVLAAGRVEEARRLLAVCPVTD